MASLRQTEPSNINATAAVGTDHLDLIGTSQGGLDHLEEILGIDGSDTEHLDLIGTSQGGLDHPGEIHGIDGSGTFELARHESHIMAIVGGRDYGFLAAIGEEDGKCSPMVEKKNEHSVARIVDSDKDGEDSKCLHWWRRGRSKPNDRFWWSV